MYLSIYHTQSSLVTLLLLLLIRNALREKRMTYAGVLAGLLCYKPQLGMVILPLLCLAFPGIIAGVILSSTLMLSASVAMVPDMFSSFPRLILWYQNSNQELGRVPAGMLSWQGVLEQLRSYHDFPGAGVIALSLSLITIAVCISVLLRWKPLLSADAALSLISLTALPSSWHVHLHDAALALLPLSVLSKQMEKRAWVRLMLFSWAATAFSYYSLVYPHPMPFLAASWCVVMFCSFIKHTSPDYS